MEDNFNNNFNENNNNNGNVPQQPDYTQQYNQYLQQNNQNGAYQNYNNQNSQYNQNGQYNPNGQYGQYPNYQYQPQQYNSYNNYVEPDDSGKGFAVTSLVLGLVSFFCCGLFAAVPGLIFGILSKRKQPLNNGLAIAGIVLSSIGILIWLVLVLFLFLDNSFDPYSYYNYLPY